ncbi:hypothetical protein D3C71_2196690 [compost metagenome]
MPASVVGTQDFDACYRERLAAELFCLLCASPRILSNSSKTVSPSAFAITSTAFSVGFA